jgi:putative ABC transport system substrate-binding protein
MMKLSRRRLIVGTGAAGLGVLAGCGRLPWQAQAPLKVPRIGVLSTARDPADATNEAFRQGLRDLGYVEGQNIAVEWRHTAGQLERAPELAAELVQLAVDLIVSQGTATTRAAKQATATIPIVMTNASDPLGAGLVASLARPGGNVTGLSSLSGQLLGKRLELLKEAVPGLTRVAMLWNPTIDDRAHDLEETRGAARMLGIDLQSAEVRDGRAIEDAFEAVRRGRAEALFVDDDVVSRRYRTQIAAFAKENRLPAISIRKEFALAGLLMSYGPDFVAMNHRAAYYVDRILKGTKPADLPVEQPMTFDFVVNMRAARTLGITFPPEIRLQITEVIDG